MSAKPVYFAVDELLINDTLTMSAGVYDPSVQGLDAPIGSIYLRSNSETWKKTGILLRGWELQPSGVTAPTWNSLTGTPTTISGYGITDGYTKLEVDGKTWGWASITGKPTTLSGYGITDAYTRTQIDTSLATKQATLTAGSVTNAMLVNGAVANLSGTNTGDETVTTIRSKLGITTLSGSNTGDQTNITGNAATASAVAWSGITNKPTTLTGYGITDAYSASNPSGYISGITSANVTTALGFTPYNSTNPNGYISSVPAQSFASLTGKPTTLAGYGITDGGAGSFANPTFTGLLGATLPAGATADRGAGVNGRIRYNTSLGITEGFGAKGWVGLTNATLAVYTGNVPVSSGTGVIPFDTSAPLITEGNQLWSQVVTPNLIDSTNKIEFTGIVDSNTNGRSVVIALFRGSVLLGFNVVYISNANRPEGFSLLVNDINTSLTPVTYSCRIGVSSAATWYLGRGATSTMGGVNASGWSIEETI